MTAIRTRSGCVITIEESGAMKNPSIKFSVEDDLKIEAEEYARAKGLVNASNLARMALVAYMRKNPLTQNQRRSATPERAEGHLGGIS